MSERTYHLHDGRRGSALAIRVTPRARKNEIFEVLSDGTVKVHLNVSPDEGAVNEMLLEFLADILGTSKLNLDIVAGTTGRDKLISVLDMDSNILHKKIIEHLQ